MADITITIPGPQLTTGQYFKERHRLLPSGSWSAYTNRSNTPFTITGLSIGDHEFEFILVNADDTHCPPVYRTHTLVGDYDCISFNALMKQDGQLFYVEVTYTLPPSHTAPDCGWRVEYEQNGNTQSFTLSALPASGVLKIPCKNATTIVRMIADMCNGRTRICDVKEVASIYIPACTPMQNVQMNVTEIFDPATGKCRYFLNITFTQSVPASTRVKLDYLQTSPGIPAGDHFSGFVNILPTDTSFTKEVHPHFAERIEEGKYYVTFTDECGQGLNTPVTFFRQNCFGKTP